MSVVGFFLLVRIFRHALSGRKREGSELVRSLFIAFIIVAPSNS
jgi:hypothetical protein